jgi:hydroxymethylbilane synthase
MSITKIKLGTRSSQLALWQAEAVKTMLQKAGFEVEIVKIETKGDKIQDRNFSKIGSKGLFTEELEQQLLNGSIHLVQHSAKDLQSSLPEGLELLALTQREQAHDVLVALQPSVALAQANLIVATSSTRRVAMLRHYYPHITTIDMRGNLQTRFRKLKEGPAQAMVLAYAGVQRMGYAQYIAQQLSTSTFVPAVGQGSIALECASSLDKTLKQRIQQACNHQPTHLCITAERAFLRALDGGCSVPVFALATISENNKIRITGGIISLNGQQKIQETLEGAQPEALGLALAQKVIDLGAGTILAEIKTELNK